MARRNSDSSCHTSNNTLAISHFNRTGSARLNDSLRKRPLQAAYITIEKEDGTLEHIPVSVNDDTFTIKQPILHSLLELGEISDGRKTPKNQSYNQVQNAVMNVMRRGSKEIDLEVPELKSTRSGSFLTPGLVEDLKRDRKRIVAKGGQCNITLDNIPRKKVQFFKDIFTTCVDMQWRWTFLAFTASFFVSWMIFAVIYYIIAAYRGDLLEEHLPASEAYKSGDWRPCIWACEDFTSYFLFSMETQHTIGYGSRQTTEKCPEAIIMVCLQSILGVLISACMAGIVFAKLARPKARTHTVMFSKNAVISQRNNQLWLMFRVVNMRRSHLIESHCRAILITHKKISTEGEIISYDMQSLPITTNPFDGENEEAFEPEDRTMLIFPTTVAHRIDKDSPFYEMGPREILAAKFELFVTLEGTVEPTGNAMQSRSSYLSNEILWAYRFKNMVSYSQSRGTYVVDCSCLNAVLPDDTPRVSRKKFEDETGDSKKVQMHERQQGNGGWTVGGGTE